MTKLHERPGYKRVPITLVIHMYETVEEDWEDEGRFFIEENHCLDNYVEALHATIERHQRPTQPNGFCTTCVRGGAFLGHVPLEAIRGVQPEPGTVNENAEDLEGTERDPWEAER